MCVCVGVCVCVFLFEIFVWLFGVCLFDVALLLLWGLGGVGGEGGGGGGGLEATTERKLNLMCC